MSIRKNLEYCCLSSDRLRGVEYNTPSIRSFTMHHTAYNKNYRHKVLQHYDLHQLSLCSLAYFGLNITSIGEGRGKCDVFRSFAQSSHPDLVCSSHERSRIDMHNIRHNKQPNKTNVIPKQHNNSLDHMWVLQFHYKRQL